MRRSTIILIVAGAMLLALPATAKKPSPKPPPSSAPVAATLNADLYEVHEAGDVIWYDVTVQNKSSAPVNVDVLYDGDGEPGSLPIEVEANSAYIEERLFSQTVEQSHIDGCDSDDEICDLIGQVTVQYPDGDLIAIAEAETSTPINPVDECIFEEDGEPVVTKSGLCIWKPEPTDTGLWTLSAVPEPAPTRPTRVMMTMRDGVPGNWCTLEDGSGGGIQDRLKGSEPTVLNVYLPDDGVCLLGGRGGCAEEDCYFAVGNPKSFYLYTTFDGFITMTETEVVPGD